MPTFNQVFYLLLSLIWLNPVYPVLFKQIFFCKIKTGHITCQMAFFILIALLLVS